MLRVTVNLTGASVVGGGVAQMFFDDTISDAQAAADAVTDFWDGVSLQMSNTVGWSVDPTVSVFDTATGALTGVAGVTVEPASTGALSGSIMPPANQVLLRLATAEIVGNRILRGRMFLPGITEDNSGADGQPTATVRDNAEAAAQALIDDATVLWCVWHRPVAGSGGVSGEVTAQSTWEKFAVLRSRRD